MKELPFKELDTFQNFDRNLKNDESIQKNMVIKK